MNSSSWTTGWTDATPRVVQSFEDPRIIYMPRPHRGVPAGRNEAIRHATAPYLAFLDSDDEWEPTKLQVQLDHFARLPENVGIVYSACIAVDGSGRVLRIDMPPAAGRGFVFERLLLTHWITFSTVMVRREVFAQSLNGRTTCQTPRTAPVRAEVGEAGCENRCREEEHKH